MKASRKLIRSQTSSSLSAVLVLCFFLVFPLHYPTVRSPRPLFLPGLRPPLSYCPQSSSFVSSWSSPSIILLSAVLVLCFFLVFPLHYPTVRSPRPLFLPGLRPPLSYCPQSSSFVSSWSSPSIILLSAVLVLCFFLVFALHYPTVRSPRPLFLPGLPPPLSYCPQSSSFVSSWSSPSIILLSAVLVLCFFLVFALHYPTVRSPRPLFLPGLRPPLSYCPQSSSFVSSWSSPSIILLSAVLVLCFFLVFALHYPTVRSPRPLFLPGLRPPLSYCPQSSSFVSSWSSPSIILLSAVLVLCFFLVFALHYPTIDILRIISSGSYTRAIRVACSGMGRVVLMVRRCAVFRARIQLHS